MQHKLRRLRIQYRMLKSDSLKYMIQGDLKVYFKKLIQIALIENEYYELICGKQAA